ncbi:MAG: uroporphyrinogen decarboxylase family protein [Clostridiales bacterium]|jgi:uroporphyrinogen decarboxylase|nr:uroporphyrinogen-III decarboxylase [Eubacteriales bacterium]MDH7566972.1 uroporphyrinogen decarboxylase family protein [Clostridiales bacterium]
MTNQELYQLRLNRIKKAIKLEKPDKTPFIPMGDAFFAKRAGVKLSEFVSNMEVSHKCLLDGVKWMGDCEATPGGSYSIAKITGTMFWSRIKLPGIELPDDTLFQIDERELMSAEDYDKIINGGLEAFKGEYFASKLNVDFSFFDEMAEKGPVMDQAMRDAGYPEYVNLLVSLPIDYLSGGRTLSKFLSDVRKMPEKVTEVMDIILDANIKEMKNMAGMVIDPIDVFIAMGRGCPDFYHPKIWEKFVWKYLEKAVNACIDIGLPANLHIDSNWERGLPYMAGFPKATCIFETDGVTDTYKVKEILGDKMCIKGDVQAAKLMLADPDEIYKYSCQLIRDMEPGFILCSGCSIPPNAKPENVMAMVHAASGK